MRCDFENKFWDSVECDWRVLATGSRLEWMQENNYTTAMNWKDASPSTSRCFLTHFYSANFLIVFITAGNHFLGSGVVNSKTEFRMLHKGIVWDTSLGSTVKRFGFSYVASSTTMTIKINSKGVSIFQISETVWQISEFKTFDNPDFKI